MTIEEKRFEVKQLYVRIGLLSRLLENYQSLKLLCRMMTLSIRAHRLQIEILADGIRNSGIKSTENTGFTVPQSCPDDSH